MAAKPCKTELFIADKRWIIMELRKKLSQLKKWIIKNFEELPESKETELIWLRKRIRAGEKIDWAFVDTVDYNIDSIPKRRELVMEFRARKKEVVQQCKNLLK